MDKIDNLIQEIDVAFRNIPMPLSCNDTQINYNTIDRIMDHVFDYSPEEWHWLLPRLLNYFLRRYQRGLNLRGIGILICDLNVLRKVSPSFFFAKDEQERQWLEYAKPFLDQIARERYTFYAIFSHAQAKTISKFLKILEKTYPVQNDDDWKWAYEYWSKQSH